MTVEEYEICRKKGNNIVFPQSFGKLDLMTKKMLLSDAIIVMKECVDNRTSAWFFSRDIRDRILARVSVFKKKTLSRKELRLMAKGYRESADDDLAMAKEFERVENEIDDECDK